MKYLPKFLRTMGGLALALGLCLVLSSCNQEDGFGTPAPSGENNNITTPSVATPEFDRTPPEVKMPEYVGTIQVTQNDGASEGLIDITNLNEGYIAAQITTGVDSKILITHNDTGAQDQYWMDSDGTMNFYPVTHGDGSYSFKLYTSANDPNNPNAYYPFVSIDGNATLVSEQAPYLVPTKLVRYTPDSLCVAESYELAAHSADNLSVAQQVFAWVAGNIEYDYDKADEIGGTTLRYEPYPDETYETRLGICYDYASLLAAMLRANGIPTKLVKGEVMRSDGQIIAHAWNMVWTEQSGWIAVDSNVIANAWNRVDPTFYATAGNEATAAQYVGDGESYTPHSEH
ncbi:transglutaminase-like domain-containing protein [Ruminococcaceae bacterium OttesenSCG-928-D13]|nr:transglutaminase-like domain-containing protein [Ruminococcaceae bacterium OttesenSCG-928-D13]